MTKPDITLLTPVMTFDETMAHWSNCNPVYEKCLESMVQKFPIAVQEIKQLFILLTDAIYINDGLLFDYCLCKAMHQYQILSSKGEIVAYDGFIKTLNDTAKEALNSYIIRDPKGGSWSIKQGMNFRDWLEEEPSRFKKLESWELEVFENR
ncbi:hypothetical protein D5R81_07685 [Parashewanella spongiae]|uniref:Uncharacterized protein n=1 Tax=Parashewanella spongiae TaxID=342950 RepID=A0A3A6UJI4_9GAMM|nr:hypothetical protein [Parashewanella spongiae]MCL1077107.1 hypothetical protein [Parashewanella spongiae]RJY17660.1 hypothetical protein D5R81_07685 [Parashewanella spongiae]